MPTINLRPSVSGVAGEWEMKLIDTTPAQIDVLLRAMAAALAPTRFIAQRHDAEGRLREVITADGAHKLPRSEPAVPITTRPPTVDTVQPQRQVQNATGGSAGNTRPAAPPSGTSGLPTCPYCGVSVGVRRRDHHMRRACPKRPSAAQPSAGRASPAITRAPPSATPTPPARRRQATSSPGQGRSVRTSCRHCGGPAIPGDDTCYSCSG